MSAGAVVWVRGLPSAGKSTFASRLMRALRLFNGNVCVLDGDAVRECLLPAPDYSVEGRAHFYETLARLAALLAAQGMIVVVPATAHRRAFRERARTLAPAFIEVWVATPLAECRMRDTKGLYARDGSAEIRNVPGIDEEYEAPTDADVVARGGTDSEALARVLAQLVRSGSTSASTTRRA
jgi:adenylylsulfate kinase